MKRLAIVLGLGLVAASAHGAEEAINPAHGFRIGFDARGVRVIPLDPAATPWEWRLSLAGDAAREVRVDGDRVELDRGRIVEWYVSDVRGLEHGFTIATKGEPHLDLALEGNLHPVFSADGRAVDFQAASGAFVLRYAQLAVFDATGRALPSRLEGVPGGIRIAFDDAGALYPVAVDPLATSPSWTGTPGFANAWYGYSVATAGDVNGDGYSDAIVGAPTVDDPESDEGRAYVYLGSPSGLSPTAAWTAESDQAGATSGWSVSTAGDVNGDGYHDVIVGAVYWTNGEYSEGRAAVYLGSPAGLAATPAWTSEGNQIFAGFGTSVSTAGDVNGDGFDDVIVGAPGYGSSAGRADVYLGSASGLSTTAAWSVGPGQAASDFGCAVATAGDVNADGYADVIVGAQGYDGPQFNGGRAYVYLGSAAGLASTPAWTVDGTQAGSSFGAAVGTAGDVNGDGYSDVVVGAPEWDAPEIAEGRVFLFLGGPAGPATTAAWTREPNVSGAKYGTSVATAGDTDGDGYADVVVGAPYWPGGRAEVFLGSASGLAASPVWVAGSASGSNYGQSVGTAGDVDGDGFSDVLVGSYLEGFEGRAHVYRGGASHPAVAAASALESDQTGAELGKSIASAGDVNGDGYFDVVVGTPSWDGGQIDEGRAAVHLGTPSGLSPTPQWTVAGDVAGAHFGISVACAGDVNGDGYDDVVVGGDGDARASVFLGSASGLSPTAAWTVRQSAGSQFGYAVASAGDVNGDGYGDVIVGAPVLGRAYVYLGSATGPAPAAVWTGSGSQGSSRYGATVASAGDVDGDGFSEILVCEPQYYSLGPDAGSCWVYRGVGRGGGTSGLGFSGTAGSLLGTSAASAGDVNRDGYSDVVVGGPGGGAVPGEVRVYLGSSAGIQGTAAWSQTGTGKWGASVASAGDLNADGYSDIVVGAPESSGSGAAFAYYGSAAGMTGPWVTWTGGQALADFGRCTASAGDVNGDGWPDVVIGAPLYDLGQSDEGRLTLHLGGGGGGRDRRLWQLRSDGSTRIALLGRSDVTDAFAIRVRGGSAGGRARVRMQWQAKPRGSAFDDVGIGTSAAQDTGPPGGGNVAEFLSTVPGLAAATRHQWRARTVSSDPYFPRGPWRSIQGNGLAESKLSTSGCVDGDGDGRGLFLDPACAHAVADCNDGNATVWSVPGPVSGLYFAAKATFLWNPPEDPGGTQTLTYWTYRSPDPKAPWSANLLHTNVQTNSDVDLYTGNPVSYYLVRAVNSCGAGSLGARSDGTPRQ